MPDAVGSWWRDGCCEYRDLPDAKLSLKLFLAKRTHTVSRVATADEAHGYVPASFSIPASVLNSDTPFVPSGSATSGCAVAMLLSEAGGPGQTFWIRPKPP